MTDRVKRMKDSLRVNKYPLCIELFRLANESLDETGVEEETTFDSFIWKGRKEDIEMVRTSIQYANWIKRMDQRFKIEEIRVQAVDRRHSGGLLFAKLFVKAYDQEGQGGSGSPSGVRRPAHQG